ncbi:hypothetical protein [Hyphomicrobium sp.]|jgi:hypothetical protein|uniref:hypothetical protein n=1 Tax=Hyphomicrobium sp. TaxID=82 RepID=UPI003563ED24
MIADLATVAGAGVSWKVKHYDDRSDILESAGDKGWQKRFTIWSHVGSPAKPFADFFMTMLNAAGQDDLLDETRLLLETILENDGLDFSTEQAAEHLVTRLATDRPAQSCSR